MKNRVATLRAGKTWTEIDLAAAVGVTRQTITAIEQGLYTPSLLLAYEIAEALDVSISNAFPPEWRRSPVDVTPRKPRPEGRPKNQTNGAA